MITLTVLLVIIGLVIVVVLSGLLDPIIAILILIGFIKLIRKIFRRKKK